MTFREKFAQYYNNMSPLHKFGAVALLAFIVLLLFVAIPFLIYRIRNLRTHEAENAQKRVREAEKGEEEKGGQRMIRKKEAREKEAREKEAREKEARETEASAPKAVTVHTSEPVPAPTRPPYKFTETKPQTRHSYEENSPRVKFPRGNSLEFDPVGTQPKAQQTPAASSEHKKEPSKSKNKSFHDEAPAANPNLNVRKLRSMTPEQLKRQEARPKKEDTWNAFLVDAEKERARETAKIQKQNAAELDGEFFDAVEGFEEGKKDEEEKKKDEEEKKKDEEKNMGFWSIFGW
jgi:hypothetical protein